MVRLVKKGDIEDKMSKYLIVERDEKLMPVYSLKKDAPLDVQEYFKKWVKDMTKNKELK